MKLVEDNQMTTPEPHDLSLTEAAAFGDLDAVQLHIDAGTDLNQKDEAGSTPVVIAALHGHKEITKVLLDNATLHGDQEITKGILDKILLDKNDHISGFVGGAMSQEFKTISGTESELGQGAIQAESASRLADTIGNPTVEHIDFASVLLRSLPEVVKLDPRVKLPLVELAVGSLRQLAPDQFASFKQVIDGLISADQAVDLFEFSLSKLVMRHLEPHFNGGRKKVTQVYSVKRLGNECSVLISALANVAGADEAAIQVAFDAGAAQLASVTDMKQLPADQCGLQQLDDALVRLNGVTLKLKRLLIQAAAASVSADGYLQRQEAELLRAISDSLDCPMPPLAIALDTAA